MRRFTLIFITIFLFVMPTLAQDGYPLLPDLAPITPDNAAQLTELASIGEVHLATFNSDAGKVFFTGDTVRGYNLKTGKMLTQQTPIPSYSEIIFGQDGNYFLSFVTSSDAALITTWSSRNPAQPLHNFEIPEDRNFARDYHLSADGSRMSDIDAGCYAPGVEYSSGAFRLWDATNGDLLFNLGSTNCGPYATAFSPDGKWAVVGWSNQIDILNIKESIQAARADEKHHLDTSYKSFTPSTNPYTDIVGVQFSPDGKQLAATMKFNDGNDGTLDSPPATYRIGIFNFHDLITQPALLSSDVEEHVDIPLMKTGYDEYGKLNVGQVRFSSDSRYLLTDDGLYDVKTGALLAAVASTTSAFSPDSGILATVGEDGLKIWNMTTLAQGEVNPLATFDVPNIQEVAFNPDGRTLYVRGANDVQVWGIPLVSQMRGRCTGVQ